MALEQADRDAYKSRVETDINKAKEALEGKVGTEGVDMEKAVEDAKGSIEKSRSGVVSSVENLTKGEGLDAAIDTGEFIKIINDLAEKASQAIDKNADKYKKQHDAIIGLAKVRTELLEPKVNERIWTIVDQMEGERGAKKAGDFDVQVTSFQQLQDLEVNLRSLEGFCDEARTVRFTILEPKATELEGIKEALGDVDPALTKQIDELLTSINTKVEGLKKAEGLYDIKLVEVRTSLTSQIQREAQKEQELLKKSGGMQEKRKTGGEVENPELTKAYESYQTQKKFVKALRDYVGFVGGKKTTGYGEGSAKAPSENIS